MGIFFNRKENGLAGEKPGKAIGFVGGINYLITINLPGGMESPPVAS